MSKIAAAAFAVAAEVERKSLLAGHTWAAVMPLELVA